MKNKTKKIVGFSLLFIILIVIKLFLCGTYLYHFWEELIPEILVLLIVSFILMIVPLIFKLVNRKRIEYKKGKPKESEEDILQLTAQTLCLEEMFSTDISEGALFYGETRRREIIQFTGELRKHVKDMVKEMHQYYADKYTPKVKYSKMCNSCSLKDICMPKMEKASTVSEYIEQALGDLQ